MSSTYLFELDYGKRVQEKIFIQDLLEEFDAGKITGCNLIVNNNPYEMEFYLHIAYSGDAEELDKWLRENYSEYFINKRKYNYFLADAFHSMSERGYQIVGIDTWMLDGILTEDGNGIFFFPDKEAMCRKWRGGLKEDNYHIFISHSSLDKKIVDNLFDDLQRKEINVFYDKHGIQAGEDIREVIDKNLDKSKVCVLCVSKNLRYNKTSWIKYEIDYFKEKGIRIIPLNIDLSKEEMIEQVGSIRYLKYGEEGYVEEILDIIKTMSR